jgi:hypothetical protein
VAILSVVVAVIVVTPAFVGFVLVVPVFLIAIFMVVADEILVVAFTAEVIIVATMFVVVHPGLRFIYDYLVAVVDIEIAVAGRHLTGVNPTILALIDELMIGNIVVTVHIGNIIIFHMIIACRTPGRLNADVDGEMNLSLCGIGEGDADEDGACQEKLFHTF